MTSKVEATTTVLTPGISMYDEQQKKLQVLGVNSYPAKPVVDVANAF